MEEFIDSRSPFNSPIFWEKLCINDFINMKFILDKKMKFCIVSICNA